VIAQVTPALPVALEGESAPRSPDVVLMAEVARGETRARDRLARRLLPAVRRIVRVLLRGAPDADDAVQLSLVETLRSAASYRGETTIERWAHRIVVRTTLRYVREQRRRSGIFTAVGAAAENVEDVGLDVANVLEAPARESLPRSIESYLARIPEVQRQALLLRHGLGHSLQEVAELTGVSENTAKARLLYGRRLLRKLVRRDTTLGVSRTSGAASDPDDSPLDAPGQEDAP
jgi:RNA polymerase sigma-70 factor (ECF subfamily)